MKKTKKITQGGQFTPNQNYQPDIILQQPQLFYFNMNSYMTAINAAKSIDFSQRAKLYDMYESAMLDLHLSGVIDKRLRGVTRIPIEFQRDGKPDERINVQLKSPWFKSLMKDLVMSKFWGYTLVQFYLDGDNDIKYDLIDRKHYNPVNRQLLKYENDTNGESIDNFENILFVGSDRDLGCMAEILPAVLYKRGNMADWAQFCNIFGMPIREYTYDAGDEEARRRLVSDARNQGSNAVYIHPKGSDLNFVESGNKTGSSELYKTFAEYWDSQMSIRVLGNTLTTDAKETGTQALGTVHKEEENDMNADDRDFLLDILNYDMTPIFKALGYNTDGGEFVYAKVDDIEPTQMLAVVQGLKNMGLPMEDDWLYETFKVQKPANYNEQIAAAKAQKDAIRQALEHSDKDNKDDKDKNEVKNALRSFFGLAPQ
jgi:phage gp29-like protein